MKFLFLLIALLLFDLSCHASPIADSLPVGQLLHAVTQKMQAKASPRLPNGRMVPIDFAYSYEMLLGPRFVAVNRAMQSKMWPEGSLPKTMQSWGKYFVPQVSSDYGNGGYYNVSEKIGYVSEDGVSFSLETNEYMGQAHPYHRVQTYWVNLNGDFHAVNDVIGKKRLSQITPLAEAAFRREEQLTPNESLGNQGLFEPSNKFVLPMEILIEGPRKLLLIYNDYEIGPYAAGSPRVYIAW